MGTHVYRRLPVQILIEMTQTRRLKPPATNIQMIDVLIIGAGPAGLMAAVTASRRGRKVLIIEKNAIAGKKLLISGSGHCNITHSGKIDNFFAQYGEAAMFVKPALLAFTNNDLIRFFEEKGVSFVEHSNGKLFPASQRSESILFVLLDLCRQSGVQIVYNQRVSDIQENDLFAVQTENGVFQARSVILATGGASYPQTGSSGDGYALAASLGHTITPIRPALVPLIVKDYIFSNCAGISIENTQIAIWRTGKKAIQASGDVLFTHKGLSGPGILDVSRNIQVGDTVKISALPKYSAETLEEQIIADSKQYGKKSLKNVVSEYGVAERLLVTVFSALKIDADTKISETNRETRRRLACFLTEMPFEVSQTSGMREAMCTNGGIDISEVNRLTMQSRINSRLFFCGEVLNVDGATGGYNLQFAFSSGYLAGK